MTALTALFFLSSFLGVNVEALGLSAGVAKIVIYTANILLYLLPVVFIVIFTIGMSMLLKTMMASNQRLFSKKETEKLPMVPYIMAIVSFILYLIFVTAVFSGAA